jgi:hypothetical protein
VGSFAAITHSLIKFCRNTGSRVYTRIAEALEELDSPTGMAPTCATVTNIKEVFDTVLLDVGDIAQDEIGVATQLVKGHRMVEVPGKDDDAASIHPEPLRPPDPRDLSDLARPPCKHECAIIKQRRHIRQAHKLLQEIGPVRGALMKAPAGQCGMDGGACSSHTVKAVAALEGQTSQAISNEGTLYCAATLHRHGLPVDFAKLDGETLPEVCACCNAPMWDQSLVGSRPERIFAWQCHTGR